MTYNKKIVVVTGASSGIGKAQAEAFLAEQAIVYGIDIQPAAIRHEQYTHFQASVASEADVMAALSHVPVVDILCNTAGILDGYATTLETDAALWNRIFDVNVKGTFHVTNAVLPKMLAQQKGVIINMASIAGIIAGGGGAAYTASKHAIVGYTKQLSYDYAKKGIRVNAIAPGAIETPMNAADFAGDASMAKWVASETPAGRWAKPEEVAAVTLFLASEAASYMHATVLPIDGGWLNK